MCQWIEIRKKGTNLQILPGNPCRCLDGDDPHYPDQFEKIEASSMSSVCLKKSMCPLSCITNGNHIRFAVT